MEVIDVRFRLWVEKSGYTRRSRVSLLARCSLRTHIGGGTDEIMIYVAGRQIRRLSEQN